MGNSKIGDVSRDGDGRRSVANPSTDVKIPDEARMALVHTKVTCPFLGSAVAMEKLPVKKWRKTRVDWVKNTTALLIGAGREYLKLKRQLP
jgi:hypothetical protein